MVNMNKQELSAFQAEDAEALIDAAAPAAAGGFASRPAPGAQAAHCHWH